MEAFYSGAAFSHKNVHKSPLQGNNRLMVAWIRQSGQISSIQMSFELRECRDNSSEGVSRENLIFSCIFYSAEKLN